MQTADTDVSIALRGEGINGSQGPFTTSVDAISAQAVFSGAWSQLCPVQAPAGLEAKTDWDHQPSTWARVMLVSA